MFVVWNSSDFAAIEERSWKKNLYYCNKLCYFAWCYLLVRSFVDMRHLLEVERVHHLSVPIVLGLGSLDRRPCVRHVGDAWQWLEWRVNKEGLLSHFQNQFKTGISIQVAWEYCTFQTSSSTAYMSASCSWTSRWRCWCPAAFSPSWTRGSWGWRRTPRPGLEMQTIHRF